MGSDRFDFCNVVLVKVGYISLQKIVIDAFTKIIGPTARNCVSCSVIKSVFKFRTPNIQLVFSEGFAFFVLSI